MFFRKNLYTWEQALRLAVSVALIVYGVLAAWGTPLGYGLVAVGAVLAITGLVGYCPMCAMFGKTLKTDRGTT